ncbi:MAG: dephospho-CoA kinase [candidate division Zixibacteria bacterium]|nr:dephospho-CoA kinase [candidate division Zixibacteria bacterium]
MLIGITGQIGAGKTTAANILKAMGAVVIDADKIGRKVVETNPKLIQKLARAFGPQILTPMGNLRRKKTAELAFSSEKNRKLLNSLVHPYLLRELKKQIKRNLDKNKVIVIDAALLLDWKLDNVVDLTLVIGCSKEKRMTRLLKKGLSKSDALARMKSQLPFRDYQKRADKVILNSSTAAAFKRKVQKWADSYFD